MQNENLGTVIIAARWHFVKEIVKDLSEYKIKNLWVLSPLVYDLFPMDIISAGNCKISAEAAIAKDVQIFADETSEIIVEFGTLIYPKAVILAANGSKIVIKSNTIIGEKALITADNGNITIGAFSGIGERAHIAAENGSIIIGESSGIGEKSRIKAETEGSIVIGNKFGMGEKANIFAAKKSRMRLGNNIHLGEKASIGIDNNSEIKINRNFSLCERASVWAGKKSIIEIDHHSSIGSFSALAAHNGGKAQLGRNVVIGSNLSSDVSSNGVLKISDFVSLGSNGMLYVSKGTTSIGEKTTVNSMFYIGCGCSKVEIGKDNMFSYYVKMNAGSHEYKDKLTGEIIDNTMPIITGNHVWVGMGSAFLPNCNIGDGCIVGAASVVNKTIPANCICAGVPAKIIRRNIEWTREKSKQEK